MIFCLSRPSIQHVGLARWSALGHEVLEVAADVVVVVLHIASSGLNGGGLHLHLLLQLNRHPQSLLHTPMLEAHSIPDELSNLTHVVEE